MASSSGTTPPTQVGATLQDYVVRVPKNQNKKFSIMRFNASVGVDFTKWSQVKMERENNMVQFKSNAEEMPKFGAGSEYGREQREEARRKKYGIISKKYKSEDQPWILQYGGKTGKKFKGVREGGVTENASYYIFTQAADGAFEAFPVEEWYNFQTIQRYKALSIEEAEEEFNARNRTLNLFNVMMRKRRNKNENEEDEDGEEAGEGKGKKKKPAKGELRISEMDDWESQSDGSSNDEDKDDDDDRKEKKKKKGKKVIKGKKKKGDGSSAEDEPLEDSDDGDGEGREVDYISSSSEESDGAIEAKHELKGVAEEDALRRLLNSDEEEEDEENEEELGGKEDENEDAELDDEAGPSKEDKDEKKKKKKDKKKKDKKPRKEDYGSSSDSDSDSSVSELEKPKPSPKIKSADNSRSGTPTKPFASTSSAEPSSDGKRKMSMESSAPPQQPKKQRLDGGSTTGVSSPMTSAADKDGVNEDSVRRYLSRKPMTTTELLQKFKSKRTGLSSDQLVHVIAQILKKINPVKQTIKGKMYLSIKG